MFAVISYKGNQFKVSEGKEYNIDLIEGDEKKITFDQVLLVSDGKDTKVGTPLVEGVSVLASVIGLARGEKVWGMKFKCKTRAKKTLGHKQDYTRVKIEKINS